MKYFLDSAKIDEITYAYENWKIDGVTTNPKHIMNSGKPFHQVIREIAEYFKEKDFPISVEINPHIDKAEDMVEEAKKFALISDNFCIKIGCTEQGLIAAKRLTEDGVNVNVTLVFSPSQALQVGRIGTKFCSPFIGWKESSGEDCTNYIRDIADIYRTHSFKTQIIAAALRNGKQIAEVARMGVDICTAGFKVYKDSFYHPFTDYGTSVFCDAWDKTDTEEK
jgi:transaldolase